MQGPKTSSGSSLDTVIVFTHQMEELASFYQKALGLGTYEQSPGHLGQQVGPVYLGFDQAGQDASDSRSGASLWFTVDDIHGVFERLVAMGARVRYPPTRKPWGGFLACVYDPDGNVLGLAQRES
jgi:predicted enzyme related to lactoylglutathione lyase